jgi:hypothetical protein
MTARPGFYLALLLLAGCTPTGPAFDWSDVRDAAGHLPEDQPHNDAGGYIPACGDLPGLVGDDC